MSETSDDWETSGVWRRWVDARAYETRSFALFRGPVMVSHTDSLEVARVWEASEGRSVVTSIRTETAA